MKDSFSMWKLQWRASSYQTAKLTLNSRLSAWSLAAYYLLPPDSFVKTQKQKQTGQIHDCNQISKFIKISLNCWKIIAEAPDISHNEHDALLILDEV